MRHIHTHLALFWLCSFGLSACLSSFDAEDVELDTSSTTSQTTTSQTTTSQTTTSQTSTTGGETTTTSSTTSETTGSTTAGCAEDEQECDGDCVKLDDPVHCGECGNDCMERAAEHSVGTCEEDNGTFGCFYECEDGFYDIDDDPDNGCEYACEIAADNPNEVCDGVDNDCDGVPDNPDAQSLIDGCNANLPPNAIFNECAAGACVFQCAPGFSDINGDLQNEANSDGCEVECVVTNQGEEQCDGIDNNCDGVVDEGCDDDGDGFCDRDLGFVLPGGGALDVCPNGPGDCNDNPNTRGGVIYPGAPEICNNLNESCNNDLVDEGCDDDGDGFCDNSLAYAQDLNAPPPAVCPNGPGDCNDDDDTRSPAATEACNDLDDNCDGNVDEGCDDDEDGFCDDSLTYQPPSNDPLPVCPNGPGDCNDDPDANGTAFNPGITDYCEHSGNPQVDDDCSGSATDCCGVELATTPMPTNSEGYSGVRIALAPFSGRNLSYLIAHQTTGLHTNGQGPAGPLVSFKLRPEPNDLETHFELEPPQHVDITAPQPIGDAPEALDAVASSPPDGELDSVALHATYNTSQNNPTHEALDVRGVTERIRQPSITRTESTDTVTAYATEFNETALPHVSIVRRSASAEGNLTFSQQSNPPILVHTETCDDFQDRNVCESNVQEVFSMRIHSPSYAHDELQNDRLQGLVVWGTSTENAEESTEGYVRWKRIHADVPEQRPRSYPAGDERFLAIEPHPQAVAVDTLNGNLEPIYIIAFFESREILTILWIREFDGRTLGVVHIRDIDPGPLDSLRIAPKYDSNRNVTGAWLAWAERAGFGGFRLRALSIADEPILADDTFTPIELGSPIEELVFDRPTSLSTTRPLDIDSNFGQVAFGLITDEDNLAQLLLDHNGQPICSP